MNKNYNISVTKEVTMFEKLNPTLKVDVKIPNRNVHCDYFKQCNTEIAIN